MKNLTQNRACELAKQYGIGAVGLKNANHFLLDTSMAQYSYPGERAFYNRQKPFDYS